MAQSRKITEAEWPVMSVLWDKGSATAGEIARQVSRERDIAERTVKSLLRRLVTKGLVGYAVDPHHHRLFHYRPLVGREEALREKNQGLLSLQYGNRVKSLLARLVTDHPMTREEIAELQAILDKKAREGDHGAAAGGEIDAG